ncbi:MAG TPA: hypothetical protein VGI82_07275, partial [Chitinophagaceae bacterium]
MGISFASFCIPDIGINQIKECFLFIIFEVFEFLEPLESFFIKEYDALGQLKKKKLGAAPLDSMVYDYNIRGWMLRANRNYVKDTTSTTNWFGFDLGYDKTSFTV